MNTFPFATRRRITAAALAIAALAATPAIVSATVADAKPAGAWTGEPVERGFRRAPRRATTGSEKKS